MSNSLDLFKQPRALDSVAHRALRYDPAQPYHFAAQQLFAPIISGEASMVAREYAIVFSDQPGSLPMALLGRARGSNAYVRESGHWMARYVPAHFRRYPFVMAESAKQGEPAEGEAALEHIVVIDADSPHLSPDRGEALFTEEGQPSGVLENVQRVLMAIEHDSQRTLKLMAELEEAQLLVERQVIVGSKLGQPVGLQGLRVVDFDRLDALDPQVIANLQRSGALALVYAHRVSLANLNDSVLVDSEAEAPSTSSGSISFDGIDWSKF